MTPKIIEVTHNKEETEFEIVFNGTRINNGLDKNNNLNFVFTKDEHLKMIDKLNNSLNGFHKFTNNRHLS